LIFTHMTALMVTGNNALIKPNVARHTLLAIPYALILVLTCYLRLK
jgi:hypothetical protein